LKSLLIVSAALLALGGYGANGTRAHLVAPTKARVFHPLTRGQLAPGSDPTVLPGPVLIADRSNNRLVIVNPKGKIIWQFPRPGDLRAGQSFRVPDDAFFSPDGKQIIATQEDNFVISVIRMASRRIVYRYGKPGVPGSGPNRLWNPDDAMLLPGGWIFTADIKNCRLLLIKLGKHRPRRIYGTTTQNCYPAPPRHWGSPNGAFPMRNGHFLVTEINGNWVDELTLAGTVIRSWHPPASATPPTPTRSGRASISASTSPAQADSKRSTPTDACTGATNPAPATPHSTTPRSQRHSQTATSSSTTTTTTA